MNRDVDWFKCGLGLGVAGRLRVEFGWSGGKKLFEAGTDKRGRNRQRKKGSGAPEGQGTGKREGIT